MLEKAKKIKEEYDRLTAELSNPDVIGNNELFHKKAKQHSEYIQVVEKYAEYCKIEENVHDLTEMLKTEENNEMREMVKQDLAGNNEKLKLCGDELKNLLTPKDPNDKKNAIMEIRAGTGGDEAGLFAAELYKMYVRYAEQAGFKIDVVNSSPTELGGYKEIIFFVNGNGAYGKLRFESGVHRVQRVPETETAGRVHTSAVTVAVLPELEVKDYSLKADDLRIEVCRSSGAGGQHVNKTESAVRIVHIPTGLEVYCQDGRSQIKNKEKAMGILAARVKERNEGLDKAKVDQERKQQIGSGDRSEKIRTYNFPQNRVTDHRVGLTIFNLEAVMLGDIQQFIDKLNEEHVKKLIEAEIK
jgi:peptide chain release factor 1